MEQEFEKFRSTEEFTRQWIISVEDWSGGNIESLKPLKSLAICCPTNENLPQEVVDLIKLVENMAINNKFYHPDLYKTVQNAIRKI